MTDLITQERLKELFDYDPATGYLIRKLYLCGRALPGARLGTRDRKGYLRNRVDGRHYFVHRLVWLYHYGVWPANQIDHINHIKDDNRIENLREATNSQNTCNRNVRSNSETGIKGVTQDKRTGRWRAHIGLNGKRIWLGYFSTKEEAAECRKHAAALHGEFARD